MIVNVMITVNLLFTIFFIDRLKQVFEQADSKDKDIHKIRTSI